MELRPGYKQTESGVLPEEWATEILRSLVRRHNSGVYKKQELYGRGCNIVGVSDLYDIHHVDGQMFARVPISERERAKYTLESGDLLYGESSLVREGIARTVYVTARGAGTAFAWHTRRYSIDKEILISAYLYYYLQTQPARKHMIDQSIQTAITGINTVAYFACPVPIPPLAEQRAIARALGDVDALLGALTQLIAKKRDLKQAATQQLLTGRTRLPGFSGEWKVKRLGKIGSFSKGKGIRKDQVVADGLPCIRYGEIYTHHNDHVRAFFSFIPSEVAKQSQRLRKGDLLFAGSGETAEEIGKCVAFLGDAEVYAGGDIVILSPIGQDSVYLGYLMNHASIADQKARMGQGDAVVHISAKHLAQLNVRLPEESEQTAIAAVLSDMDAEISVLEQRLAKTRDLKQGMMQELLTGRTRLV